MACCSTSLEGNHHLPQNLILEYASTCLLEDTEERPVYQSMADLKAAEMIFAIIAKTIQKFPDLSPGTAQSNLGRPSSRQAVVVVAGLQ